jgi:hypothetical protein
MWCQFNDEGTRAYLIAVDAGYSGNDSMSFRVVDTETGHVLGQPIDFTSYYQPQVAFSDDGTRAILTGAGV